MRIWKWVKVAAVISACFLVWRLILYLPAACDPFNPKPFEYEGRWRGVEQGGYIDYGLWKKHFAEFGIDVPPDVYDTIRNETVWHSMIPPRDAGGGLVTTELEATGGWNCPTPEKGVMVRIESNGNTRRTTITELETGKKYTCPKGKWGKSWYRYAVLIRETKDVVTKGVSEGYTSIDATEPLYSYSSDDYYQVFVWGYGEPCHPDVPEGACK